MKIKTLMFTAFAGLLINYANAANKSAVVIDRSTQAIDSQDIVDTSEFETLSVQLIYSTANPQSQTIKSGVAPFVQASVTNWRLLQGRASTMTFTIPFGKNAFMDSSTPALTINGKEFTYGVHWSSGSLSSHTIISLRDAVNLYANGEYAATASSNVLTIWAASSGSYANSWYATSSTGFAILAGTSTSSNWRSSFSNGNDYGYFSINDIRLTEGTSFYAVVADSITAKSISNAIASHNKFSGVVVSSHSGSVIYTTASYNSVEQIRFSAGNGLIAINVSTISQTPNINIDFDTVTIQNHNFTTGLPVTFSTQVPNSMPNGLFTGVTYFIYAQNENVFKIAPTRIAASTGGFINFSIIPVDNSSVTVTPIPFMTVGTSGFKWQASNDRSTWADFSVSSVTSTSFSASSSTLWGFSQPTYRYYRGSYSPPMFGGNNFRAIFYGKGN